jgi:hypothetical protein
VLRVVLEILQLLYVPIGLALGRLFVCRSSGELDVDDTVQCGSAIWIVFAVFAALVTLPVLLGGWVGGGMNR